MITLRYILPRPDRAGSSPLGRRRAACTASAGSVLIAVLWLIGILSLIVSAFAFEAHLETRVAGLARNRRQAEAMALSGFSLAEMLLARQTEVSPLVTPDPADRWHSPALRLSRGEAVRGLRETIGQGEIVLSLVPEDSLRNVNRLEDEDWERVLDVGGVPEELWPDLIDAFYHWVNRSGHVLTDASAIDDYYAAREPPYEAKKGPLDTVHELLLVKGFSKAIVSGGVLNPEAPPGERIHVSGIQDLLTTYGEGKVNVNAVGERVLRTLPGIDLLAARAILEERGDLHARTEGLEMDLSFTSNSDFARRIPELDVGIGDLISTHSTIFRVTSEGRFGRSSRKIEAIAEWDPRLGRAHILRWREDF